MKTYLDTSALIAFLDKSDIYHGRFKQLFDAPPSLITSSAVIIEGHCWFLRRYDTFRAIQFLNFIGELKTLIIESVSYDIIEKAKPILQKYKDKKLTLVDSIGLYIIQKNKLKICWSTDRHLTLSGASLPI